MFGGMDVTQVKDEIEKILFNRLKEFVIKIKKISKNIKIGVIDIFILHRQEVRGIGEFFL